MSSWKQAVQAELLFAQKTLSEAVKLEMGGGHVLASRQYRNNAILCVRELWVCWLNEWVELLKPKEKLNRVSSWQEFEMVYSGFPSVDQLKEELKQSDSWSRGFIELEALSAFDWLDAAKARVDDNSTSELAAYDALNLVQLEIRPCSVLQGLEDITRMLTALKLFIEQVREQHSEW